MVEIRRRTDGTTEEVALEDVVSHISTLLAN